MKRPSVSTTKFIRWTARVLGILFILIFVGIFFYASIFFSADGLSMSRGLQMTRHFLPLNWIIPLLAVYILAWKWERTSGVLILLIYIIHGIHTPGAWHVPFFIMMAIPGLLFLMCSLEGTKRTSSKD